MTHNPEELHDDLLRARARVQHGADLLWHGAINAVQGVYDKHGVSMPPEEVWEEALSSILHELADHGFTFKCRKDGSITIKQD